MPTVVPSCPRCGYDLSGGLASRRPEAGTGICSECGLTFAWEDVLNPDRLVLRGFVEHARGFFQTFRWAWRTFFGSFIPLRFWRRVRLEHAPRPWRWLAYLLATAGLFWLTARVLWLAMWVQLTLTGSVVPNLGSARRSTKDFIIEHLTNRLWSIDWQTGRSWAQFSPWRALPPAALAALAAIVMMPVMLLVLPDTRARLKIRAGHVARAGVYGALPVLIAVILLSILDVQQAARIWLMPTGTSTFAYKTGIASLWYEFLDTLHSMQLWLGGGALLWLLWWWAEAIRTGFRADQWKRILLVQWLAGLLAAAIIVFLHPDARWLLVNWLA